jgi:hypothetical protein
LPLIIAATAFPNIASEASVFDCHWVNNLAEVVVEEISEIEVAVLVLETVVPQLTNAVMIHVNNIILTIVSVKCFI